ncbi:MAG: L,D-transpeptidase family protein [Chloroflexi bacterium]|nr:L,D-transpeptidase family protein [Chloroflexota bacterium]
MSQHNRRIRRRPASRTRERILARQQRRLATREKRKVLREEHAFFRRRFPAYDEDNAVHRALAWLFSSRSPLAKLTSLVTISVLVFFIGSYVVSGRIFPNIYTLGLPLSGLTPEAAEGEILTRWQQDVHIDITIDGERLQTMTPEALGLTIDAAAMAASAKAAGMAGIPFGLHITPAVRVAHAKAQTVLLDMTEDVFLRQYEAGYKWSGGTLVAVPGHRGRQLDVTGSLQRLKDDVVSIVTYGQFELTTNAINPTVLDSTPFLDEALVLLDSDLRIRAYDPFSDQMSAFSVTDVQAAEWLTAGVNGLSVREEAFRAFIEAENSRLIVDGRYIDELEAVNKLQAALNDGNPDILLRLRYLPSKYQIERQDTGYTIGRKRGTPFEFIRAANPTVNWNQLVIGQEVQMPSRDSMLPVDPVPHKRVVVDLESQWLLAFDNRQLVFSWPISSGRERAETYPGIFQILTHNEVASGGSYALCNEAGTDCAHWKMKWFMGIYEVVPGLMNGFHGAVELPNGNYLGGGGVYEPTTFGCIMSLDSKAEQLYRWAEKGTMVEIVSQHFLPESDIAKYALEFISTIDTTYRPITG